MGAGSDFKPFMRAGVPEAVQRAALRKLWRSNPVLANLDGLVDYADDYTDAAVVRPNMKTAYKVAQVVRDAIEKVGVKEGDAPLPDGPPAVAEDAPEQSVADANDSNSLVRKPPSA